MAGKTKPMRCNIDNIAEITIEVPEGFAINIESLCVSVRHVDKVKIDVTNIDVQEIRPWPKISNTVRLYILFLL